MVERFLEDLIERYPVLAAVQADIFQAYQVLEECYANGNKLLIAGNGGSSADSEHIVGELMKGFVKSRPVQADFAKALKQTDEEMGAPLTQKLQGSLPAIALSGHAALSTAYLNDVDGDLCYAQQLYGYGKPGDVFLAISTSGNAKNVLYACVVAKAKGMKLIGLSGKTGGRMNEFCDINIVVPEQETYKIQELHLPVYHTLCLMLEERFF